MCRAAVGHVRHVAQKLNLGIELGLFDAFETHVDRINLFKLTIFLGVEIGLEQFSEHPL